MAMNGRRVSVHLGPDERAEPGDLIESNDGDLFIVECLLETGAVIARPERWYERVRAWLREHVGHDRHALPFPHVVVGNWLKVNLGPGHGCGAGDILRLRCGRWRWREFQIAQVADGCVFVHRPR